MTSGTVRAMRSASAYSAKLPKSSRRAASCRRRRMSSITCVLSYLPAVGPRSEARVLQAS